MTSLAENFLKREIPDALVITGDLGAVGFCHNPEAHAGKHPRGTFVVRLTREQMDEIRAKALKGTEDE